MVRDVAPLFAGWLDCIRAQLPSFRFILAVKKICQFYGALEMIDIICTIEEELLSRLRSLVFEG